MRLFDGDPYNGYERIRRAAPSFWNNIAEAQAVWETSGIEHDKIRAGITEAYSSILVPWAENDGLRTYEDFLRVEYTGDVEPDIDFRRAMVAAQFTGQRHIGRPEIQQLVNRFSERNVTEVHLDHGNVVVRIDAYGGFDDDIAFFKMLQKKLPAHLGLGVTLRIIKEARYQIPISIGLFETVQDRTVRDHPVMQTKRLRLPMRSSSCLISRMNPRLIREEVSKQ